MTAGVSPSLSFRTQSPIHHLPPEVMSSTEFVRSTQMFQQALLAKENALRIMEERVLRSDAVLDDLRRQVASRASLASAPSSALVDEDLKMMRGQIEALLTEKSELISLVDSLRGENANLRSQMDLLIARVGEEATNLSQNHFLSSMLEEERARRLDAEAETRRLQEMLAGHGEREGLTRVTTAEPHAAVPAPCAAVQDPA